MQPVMEQLCDSPFWDANLTWNNTWPEFTECFQNVALIGGPCVMLWITSLFHAFYLSRSPDDELPISRLYKKRMLLSTGIVRMERQKGVLTSVVLFYFWLGLTVAQLVPFYTIILKESYATSPTECCLFYVRFGLIVVQLFLHSFAEKPKPKSQKPGKPGVSVLASGAWPQKPGTRQNYEIGASVLSQLTHSFMGKFIEMGHAGEITADALSDIWDSEKAHSVFPRFSVTWQADVSRAREKNKLYYQQHPDEAEALLRSNSTTEKSKLHRSVSVDRSNSLEEKKDKPHENGAADEKKPLSPRRDAKSAAKSTEKEEKSKAQPKYTPSLFWAQVKTYWQDFVLVQIARAFHLAFTFVYPLLFGALLDFMDDPTAPSWRGFFLCGLIFVANLMEEVLIHTFHYHCHRLALRLKHAATNSVFKKALTMDTEARQESTVGQAVNLMSDDVNQIVHMFSWMLHELWTSPIKIVFCLYMLYTALGPSMLYGVLLLAALVPIQLVLVRTLTKMHKERMEQKDERLKSLTEVINGVKILKMYAWEPSFFDKVNDVRNKELDNSWRATVFETIMHCYWCVTPYAVSVVVFVSYIYASEDHYLSPSVAFMVLSLMDILRHTMGLVPHIINCMVKTVVSFQRVNEFLFRNDLEEDVSHDADNSEAISIKDGTFSWTSDATPTLKNIDVSVKKESLVAVVGTGSVAYVAQQAWIQHATLRDNVLFGTDMEQDRYDKCLDVCCLRPDLDILPGGDQTEIGEKGINLSGGQKQRVSLARAVYSNADLYLLDDPLSAVDCHVGSHIFNQVIGHQGLLAGKTRVLVTHGVQWLPLVDQVIVMKHGRVSEVGTYDELLSHNGPFAKFLKHHFAHHQENEEDPEEDRNGDNEAIIQELLRTISQDETVTSAVDDSMENTDSSKTDEKQNGEIKQEEKTKQNADKKDKSKLVDDEDDEIQQANIRATLKEMSSNLGYSWVFLYLVLFLAQQGAERYGSVSLSQWTDDPQLSNLTSLPADSKERMELNNYYLTLFAGFGVIHALTTMFGRLVMLTRMVVAARKRHCTVLDRHLNTVDQDLPHTVAHALDCTLGLLGKRYFYPTMRHLEKLSSKTRSPIYSFFSETLGGTTTVRAYGAQDRFLGEFQKMADLHETVHFNWGNCNRWLGFRLTVLGLLTSLGVCVTAVTLRDTMSAGMVGLAVSVAMDVTGTLHGLMHVMSWLQTRLPSVERIKEYSEMDIEAEWRKEENKPSPSWPQAGEVKVDDLAVRYREGMELVLKGINVNIAPGEKVGIVGRTGAGKSSLTLALFRLIEPARGHVTIDDVNTSELGLHDLRSRLTILPQDPVIFAGSVRMNLDPFSRYTDQQLWEALRHAHLTGFVDGLQDGLGHDCGEGGENLSVGQRQLLCLARTLLHKTHVLVLDEATAAVDMETDELIQRTIRSEFSECTVLTIAHRLNTVIDYD
ncbi:hypothetical protein BaRGS_00005208, partial [Batillaria attramentaria]